MTFAQAIAVLTDGHMIRNSNGGCFWLERDKKERIVLVGKPPGYDRPVRNLVFSSEHFEPSLEWSIEPGLESLLVQTLEARPAGDQQVLRAANLLDGFSMDHEVEARPDGNPPAGEIAKSRRIY